MLNALRPASCPRRLALAALVSLCSLVPRPAAATDQIYFPALQGHDAERALIDRINAEPTTGRIDMSIWLLTDRNITQALVNRFLAGVPVRLIGDRVSIFEGADNFTRGEFYYAASHGVPIRVRYNPTWFPEINHWKATIFVGQGIVTFGSANYTPFELVADSPTNFKDETVLFTDDPQIVAAVKMKFDIIWNDTTPEPNSIAGNPPYLKNWNQACQTEPSCDFHIQYPNAANMVINTNRLAPNAPLPDEIVWSQGWEFNSRLVTEIGAGSFVDLVIYRLTVENVTEALKAKKQSGAQVRVIVEPDQYLGKLWPEYELTHANIDKLWAAGVPIKIRTHVGLTHMKMLVTQNYATNASSNYSENWQRDINYFVPASKTAIYTAMRNRFQEMWSDGTNFGDFTPLPADAAELTSPAHDATGVSTTPTLVWNRAPFATSYDVLLGPAGGALLPVANIPAVMTATPPATYSWTPSSPLAPGTNYIWRIVSRTYATEVDPTIIRTSAFRSFTTMGTGGTAPGAPGSPSPANGASGVATNVTLSWSASGATSYDVRFGTANPPPLVSSSQPAASYAPGALNTGTTYFWQIVARNAQSATTGPVWSFTTTAGGGGGGVPAPWVSQDIGPAAPAGSATLSGGTFTVRGAGADIWGTSDGFHYVHQPLTGDGQIVARVATTHNTHPFAKAGVMIRNTLNANSIHAILDVRPNGVIEWLGRSVTGGHTSSLGVSQDPAPVWLRLTRSNTTITAEISANGSSWDLVGSTSLALGGTAHVGLVVCSHDNGTLNTSTFDNVSVTTTSAPTLPGTPGSPSPANGATGVAANATLSWSASNATAYDVRFGTANPPPLVSSNQPAASYAPGAMTASTTYFWQIVARNASGTAPGPVWSFTTVAPTLPGTPGSPSPANGATGVATNATLTWSASNATAYDVRFGTVNPPPLVSSSQAAASYTPQSMNNSTAYFWQIVARNASGSTNGPVWSFTTGAAPPPSIPEIVIYANDPQAVPHGSWTKTADATSPGGIKLATPDNEVAHLNSPLPNPVDYVDVTFNADANRPYTIWLRLKSLGNIKWNDAVWVQFSDARAGGSPIYGLNTNSALMVNLATDATAASLANWGWQNGAYWLSQPTTITFANGGAHTMRIQVREDGVQLDQIVLSSNTFLSVPPGGVGNDSTIVPKP